MYIVCDFACIHVHMHKIEDACFHIQILYCLHTNDMVPLPLVLVMHHRIKGGGNGVVYTCNIVGYRGSKQLACKKEHKVCYS